MMAGDSVVWQPRCPHCGREHYALNQKAISYGYHGCEWCAAPAQQYRTVEDYRRALREGRERRGDT